METDLQRSWIKEPFSPTEIFAWPYKICNFWTMSVLERWKTTTSKSFRSGESGNRHTDKYEADRIWTSQAHWIA